MQTAEVWKSGGKPLICCYFLQFETANMYNNTHADHSYFNLDLELVYRTS